MKTMSEATNATLGAPGHLEVGGQLIPTDTMSVHKEMVVITWAAFLIAFFLLHRLAWRPLLRALDKRERDIRGALDEAERAHKQAAADAERNRQAINEAAERARAMQEEARVAAERAAARMDQESREKSRRLLEDAEREIDAARQRAVEGLRREAAELAIGLSEKMLAEQMTPEQRHAYQARMIEKLPS